MKPLFLILITLAMATETIAASAIPKVNTNSVDISKISGNYDSFTWVWPMYSAQSNTIWFTTDGSTTFNLTGYSVEFKVVRKSSDGQTEYIHLTNSDLTVSTNSVTFSIVYTNVPLPGRYLAEVWCYQTATTSKARVIAQGIISAIDSLFAH